MSVAARRISPAGEKLAEERIQRRDSNKGEERTKLGGAKELSIGFYMYFFRSGFAEF